MFQFRKFRKFSKVLKYFRKYQKFKHQKQLVAPTKFTAGIGHEIVNHPWVLLFPTFFGFIIYCTIKGNESEELRSIQNEKNKELKIAIIKNDKAAIQKCINGVTIDEYDILSTCFEHGSLDTIKMIMSAIDPKFTTYSISAAISRGDIEIIKFLASHKHIWISYESLSKGINISDEIFNCLIENYKGSLRICEEHDIASKKIMRQIVMCDDSQKLDIFLSKFHYGNRDDLFLVLANHASQMSPKMITISQKHFPGFVNSCSIKV